MQPSDIIKKSGLFAMEKWKSILGINSLGIVFHARCRITVNWMGHDFFPGRRWKTCGRGYQTFPNKRAEGRKITHISGRGMKVV